MTTFLLTAKAFDADENLSIFNIEPAIVKIVNGHQTRELLLIFIVTRRQPTSIFVSIFRIDHEVVRAMTLGEDVNKVESMLLVRGSVIHGRDMVSGDSDKLTQQKSELYASLPKLDLPWLEP